MLTGPASGPVHPKVERGICGSTRLPNFLKKSRPPLRMATRVANRKQKLHPSGLGQQQAAVAEFVPQVLPADGLRVSTLDEGVPGHSRE